MKCSNACILLKCTASTGVGIAGVGITGVGKAGASPADGVVNDDSVHTIRGAELCDHALQIFLLCSLGLFGVKWDKMGKMG